ncbi:hypothetical protein COCOR_05646 [Corallococcus coralloides DSM 2259]|uniref:Lipoprotein n=1 Tax=Corallococcus coralloides (strain ATCC 25202 / DSM 2259 / NBRC 100086 / M2) TaxID=1144275 RepID=H8N250_CORCM|nr:hypothetical protein [Corallococcus coralloides]AFE06495.1 hypothetical protein COCOR_05646 [Corallococcus coralloides DSM 2259]
MKKLIGVFASVALLGSGVAFAQDSATQGSQQPSTSSGSMQGSSESTGGSGSSSMMGSNELTGKVVKSDSKKVYISSTSGAVVPLEVDKNTQFTDPSMKNAKSLKEGQEIRASFQVKDEKNMATSISPSSGTGGSGSDPMAPDSSINEGTGGSGMDDKNQDMGNDSTMNPDTGSSTDSSSSPKTY